MDRSDLLRLARAGALARLAEIDQERQAIFREFPDLRRGDAAQTMPVSTAKGRRSRRGAMSAAQRKAVSERMRKYWAARRGESPSQATQPRTVGRHRRKMSAEARKKIAEAQRKRWAEQRAKQAKAGEQGAATQSPAAGSGKKR
jgi:hypothetical protein